MIGAFLAAAFQNDAFQIGGEPTPVTWGGTGGIEKRKHPVKQNERPVIEKAISDAIKKVTGIGDDEPSTEIAKPFVLQPSPYRFDEELLRQQAALLNQSIEEYRLALIRAELDDEETLLLLL